MSVPDVKRISLGEGIYAVTVRDTRFKTSRISLSFALPQDIDTASATALAACLCSRGCAGYPTYKSLQTRLEELYGAYVFWTVRKQGDYQIIRLGIEYLCDKYAFDGENISAGAAELLSELIFNPFTENGEFGAAQFAEAHRLLIEKIESEINDKTRYALTQAERLSAQGEPGGIPAYGRLEEAREVTAADAYAALKNMLATAAVQINFLGGGDFSLVRELFAKGFKKIRRAPVTLPEQITKPARSPMIEEVENMQLNQDKLVIILRSGNSVGMADSAAHKLMADMFGGGPYSLLFEHVREELSLCYFCSARYNLYKNMLAVVSGVESDKVQIAREEIQRQFKSVRDGVFSQETFSAAKAGLTDSYMSASDEISSMDEWYAAFVTRKEVITLEDFAGQIGNVTAEQVAKAAAEFEVDCVYLLSGESPPVA